MADAATPVLLFGFMFGAAAGAVALAIRYRRHAARTRQVMLQADDTDLCVACNGSDVSEPAPQAYRCNACGFTWGSGLQQLRARAQRDSIEAMSADERRQSGVQDLEQAKLVLLAAKGSVDAALEASRMDMQDVNNHEAVQKHDHITRTLTQAREARGHIDAAKLKLRGPSANTLEALDVEVVDLSGDHHLFDSFDFHVAGVAVDIGDEKIHREIDKLDKLIAAMLASVERALVLVQRD